jgi:hypothetical protein
MGIVAGEEINFLQFCRFLVFSAVFTFDMEEEWL